MGESYTFEIRRGVVIGSSILFGFILGIITMIAAIVVELAPTPKANSHLEIDIVPIPHNQPKPPRPKGDTGDMVRPAIHA